MKQRRSFFNGIAAVSLTLFCSGFCWSSGITTHQLVVGRVSTPPVMDGRLDDPAWAKAPEAGGFTVVGSPDRKAAAPTFVKAVTDGKSLYFGFRCIEPKVSEIKIRKTPQDTDTWLQESVEVVLDPANDRTACYHIIANVSGGGFDSRMIVKPLGLIEESSDWNGGMEVSSSRGTGEWYAEIRIPFDSFGIDPSKSPVAGVNFNRTRLLDGNQLSCWSPNRVTFPEITDLGDLIIPAADGSYCRVKFPEPVSVTTATPSIPFEVTNDFPSAIRPKLIYRNAGPHSSQGELQLETIPHGKTISAELRLPGITEGAYKFDAKVVDAVSWKDLFTLHRDLEVTQPILFDESLYALYHKRVEANIDIRVPSGGKPLKVSLLRKGFDKPIAVKTFAGKSGKIIKASFDLDGQPQGTYLLRADLGSLAPVESRDFAYKPDPKVGFNDDGHMLVDGKPFFPVGIYGLTSGDPKTRDKVLQEAKDAGFNCTVLYPQDLNVLVPMLEAIDRYGIKAFIYPTVAFTDRKGGETAESARKEIDERRNLPAVIGWYVVDEPEGQGGIPPKAVRDLYQIIKEHDQDHPCMLVIMSPEAAKGYRAATDIMALDPYPIPKQPVTIISDFVHRSVQNIEKDKPLWSIPQAFDWGLWENGKIDGEQHPTADEERCMTYLALVNGAKGIIYWSFTGSKYHIMEDYPEHWMDVKKIASEVRDLSPVLMTGTSGGKLSVTQSGTAVQTMLKEYDGAQYVLAVNSSRTACSADFGLAGSKASSIEVLFENRSMQGKDGSWTDVFKPLEVHVYKMTAQ